MSNPEIDNPDTSQPDTDVPAGQLQPAAPAAVLRDMVAADIDFITALDKTLFGVDSWPRQMFVDELAQPETRRYIIAELPAAVDHGGAAAAEGADHGGGRAVGYAGLMCLPPIGDIQTIGVLPDFEGRGIARAMMDELIAESVRRGAGEVMLEVSSTNPRAQRLYERYGFTHIHTRRRYYRDGSDGLIMRLSLPAPGPSTISKDQS